MDTISPWMIYWVMQMGNIQGTFVFLSVILGTFTGIALIVWGAKVEVDRRDTAPIKKMAFGLMKAFLVVLLIVTFIPTTKTLVTVFAVPTLIQVAADVELDETAKKSIAAVNKMLDAYIDETE